VTQHLLEDHAGVESHLFVLVTSEDGEDDLWLCGEVLDSRPPRADLPAQEVVEYLYDILPGLKFEPADVEDEVVQQVCLICLLGQLSEELWCWV